MDFIVNDCSLHGQFQDHSSAVASLRRVFDLRARLRRSGRQLYCPRGILAASVGPGTTLRQVVNTMSDRELRNVVVTWLASHGPFWDDDRVHGLDDYFEVKSTGAIVTDTGLAEAAMSTLRGVHRSALSFEPSSWQYTPIEIDHVESDATRETVSVVNCWSLEGIERHLQATRPALQSWDGLVQWTREECPLLTLTPDVIRWLDGYPFIPGAAERFQALLSTLNALKASFDETGSLTNEGKRILQSHFTGKKAWFSDSSDAEKRDFREELEFPNPESGGVGDKISCPWHGKVKIQQMRVHFTYPIRHDRPLYIVYIGPKLTKR